VPRMAESRRGGDIAMSQKRPIKPPEKPNIADKVTRTVDRGAGMVEWSRTKLCDVASLSLGTILFFSPWLFDLPAGAPRETALIIGLLIAVSSIAALVAYAGWEGWLKLIAGPGLIAAPWLLGFENDYAITLYTAIGTLVFAFAALELWLTIAPRAGHDLARSRIDFQKDPYPPAPTQRNRRPLHRQQRGRTSQS
jgi:hypothetical protein